MSEAFFFYLLLVNCVSLSLCLFWIILGRPYRGRLCIFIIDNQWCAQAVQSFYTNRILEINVGFGHKDLVA